MNECLIYFKFSILENKERIKTLLLDSQEYLMVNKISSVFKRKKQTASSLEEMQEFVIRVNTKYEVEELFRRLNIREHKAKLSYHVELLAFNNEIKLIPNIALPHPSLFLDPLVLHCSAEIWPEYIHPVNKLSLRKSDIETNMELFEFLYQGKFFLDP